MGIVEAYEFSKFVGNRIKEDGNESHPGMKMVYGKWVKVGGGHQNAPQPEQRMGSRASYMPRTPLPDNTQLKGQGQEETNAPPGTQQPSGAQQPAPGTNDASILAPSDQQRVQAVSSVLGISPKVANIAVGAIGAAAVISNMANVAKVIKWAGPLALKGARSAVSAARGSKLGQNIGKSVEKVSQGASSARSAWTNGEMKSVFAKGVKDAASATASAVGSAAFDVPLSIKSGAKASVRATKKGAKSIKDTAISAYTDRKRQANFNDYFKNATGQDWKD